MIECIFGWGKQHGTMRKTKHRGLASVSGRGADYSTPPPQIPACSFPAPGSRRMVKRDRGFGRHRSAGSLLQLSC
jgi:hypothetical protein